MVVTVSQDAYPVLWIGQAAVVTLPVEVDITNADRVREDLHEQDDFLRLGRSKRPGARVPAGAGE
jgi:hypothetical protein